MSPLAREILEVFQDYASGGKKVRGALTVLGYQVAGGRDGRKILPASCAVELFHNFLLIHDDIIDQDKRRRGKPTVHEYYRKIHQDRYRKGDSRRYGNNMAIMAGDVGAFLAYELLTGSNFSRQRIVEAAQVLNDFLVKTAYGEIFDVTFDFHEDITWDEILLVRTYKTAYYTIVMPLSVGAILGGADSKQLEAIEEYGVPIGIAFQITDDILGVFGQEKTTGKTTVGDIKEGKKTFLFAKATELATPRERRYLKAHYGEKNITASEVKEIKRIFKESGVLHFSSELAVKLSKKGKKAVPKITRNREAADTLLSLADFVVERGR